MPTLYGRAKDARKPSFNFELPLDKDDFLILLDNHYCLEWFVQKHNGACGYISPKYFTITRECSSNFDSTPSIIAYVEAINDHNPKGEDELKLIRAETLSVLEKHGSGRWKVVKRNGSIGWIDSKYVREIQIKSTPTAIEYVEASQKLVQIKSNELREKNEQKRSESKPEGWIAATSSSLIGWFKPKNITETDPTKLYGVAIRSYEPQSNEELELKEGDFLIILENYASWRWRVQNANGSFGFVPAGCVELIRDRPAIFDSMPTVISYAMANYGVQQRAMYELRLVEGEHLSVLGKEMWDRWRVIKRDGSKGWIQAKNLTEIDIIPAKLPTLEENVVGGINESESTAEQISDDLIKFLAENPHPNIDAQKKINKLVDELNLLAVKNSPLTEIQQPPEPSTSNSPPTVSTLQTECCLCLEGRPNHIILNCGHMCLCNYCGIESQNKMKECPICRQALKSILKVYF